MGFIRSSRMIEKADNLVHEVESAASLERLAEQGIYTSPTDNSDPNFLETVGAGLSLTDILKIYTDTASIFEKLEEASTKVKLYSFIYK